MDSSPYLENLVERVRRGDHEAFDRLTSPFRPRLEAVIRLRLPQKIRRRVDLDDVIQETLLRAFCGMREFEWSGRARFSAWLATLAERTCADLFRKHVTAERAAVDRERSLDEPRAENASIARLLDALDGGATGPSKNLAREERLQRLEAAISELSDEHREVVILSAIQGLPTREVAERLDRSVSAVCMLRTRALRRLREVFGNTESCRLPGRPLDLPAKPTSEPDSEGS
ncbi:MAG: sigma-70 family RNA polymerase sigma factor [Planctomycetota bacterium]